MKLLGITNQKGGVGKTTTAVAMASILNAWGHKTLLIDVDPQCNSTDTYRASIKNTYTLYDLLLAENPCTLEQAIQHTEFGDIIASDPGLEEAEDSLHDEENRFEKLAYVLRDIHKLDYEFVIFDTNPSLNTLLVNTLAACDHVIIPSSATRYSARGLADLSYTLERVRNEYGKCDVVGILPVNIETRAKLHRANLAALDDVAREMGTRTFSTPIRHAIAVSEAQDLQKPLIVHAPKSKPEQDYEAFVKEMLEVINHGNGE